MDFLSGSECSQRAYFIPIFGFFLFSFFRFCMTTILQLGVYIHINFIHSVFSVNVPSF